MKNNQITDEQKYLSLELLLKSKEFDSQDKYTNLLKYLFDASIQNKQIKESTIAADCFNKDESYDPSVDSYVRVYLSKLRKKLEHFYLTEGIGETVQITIPKGHYSLEFKEVEKRTLKYRFSVKFLTKTIPLFLLIAILSYFLGAKFGNKIGSSIPGNDLVWQEILTAEKKTLVVMGDYYFFSFPFSEDRKSYIRDVEINSNSDLELFIKSNPNLKDKIKPIYHTYLDEHIPLCISYILPSFIANESRYEFKLASEVQLNDFNNFNIVYIGSYKSLNLLSNIIGKLNFKYEVHQPVSSITFQEILTNKSFNYEWIANTETSARNDYAMVIKVKGPSNNSFMFFLSEHDFGNISTVKYFTNLSQIEVFEEKLTSKYFEALFEVKGIKRTDFSMDLLNLNQLENDFTIDIQSKLD